MGKAGDAEQAVASPAPATSCVLRQYAAAVGKALNAKCAFLLLLGVGAFLSAFFLLLHLRASGITPDPDDPAAPAAEIQAGFILLKPVSELTSNARRLEEDIFKEIAVPNTKVSVSLHKFKCKDSTYVTVGILPDPRNASISAGSMKILKATLIELTLEQLNLSLTPSVFGDPFCLEILGFPGGITVRPPQSDPIVDSRFSLLDFAVNRTIHEIREHFQELKSVLRVIFELTPDEDLLIEITNKNGSTVNPPVILHFYLIQNDCITDLQPYRLKQLAQIITKWNSRNLGLNPFVFGRIKDLKLSPYLQGFIPCAPNSSPTTSSPSSSPPSPKPTTINPHKNFLCPAFLKRQNATFLHPMLMRLSSTVNPPQLPTRFDIWKQSRGKKNSLAVAAPTFIAPAPQPK